MTDIRLYNTLSRTKETLTPMDASNVRMYVCGPTVYDRPHIGNARSVVVYDVLYRLLSHLYGEKAVTYARNITDVDDKINARAVERKITIKALTDEVTAQFHGDMDVLGALRPTIEPRATEHISHMIAMIETLIARGHAYAADGHVLFDTTSYADYGSLSRRSQDDMLAGARVEVASYKKDAGDFVLWKPSHANDDASSKFQSPWGEGRPGWHIECSAMATEHLGETFDIHGGGADLMFPHHENEIAQSCCASDSADFAKIWVHNGFLTVNGEKMSKSLGNFTTVKDLLQKGIEGEVIRLALMSTQYRKPLDWTDKLVHDAKKQLDTLYRHIADTPQSDEVDAQFVEVLSDDMNVPEALARLHKTPKNQLASTGALIGILQQDAEIWFKGTGASDGLNDTAIDTLIADRVAAKAAKNWAEADKIRDVLKSSGIVLEDRPDGTTDWRRE